MRVGKASIGPTQVANFDMGITAISGLASQTSADIETSRVIQLLNMVTHEELMDGEDYDGMSTLLTMSTSEPNIGNQKSVKTSRKSVPSLDLSWSSRCLVHLVAAGSLLAWERST